MRVLYPFGATLTVRNPAVPILTSGEICFPQNRCIAASVRPYGAEGGSLFVLGSATLLNDEYIKKESNVQLLSGILNLFLPDPGQPGAPRMVDAVDEDLPELGEPLEIPEIGLLSERLRSCLQELDPLPADFTTLFNNDLFEFSTGMIPEILKTYTQLDLKAEPITVISPQFVVPHPPLQAAVFYPQFQDPPPPSLELFDLDDHFVSVPTKLAQVANKCDPHDSSDLEYFVEEAGEVLGVASSLPAWDKPGPKPRTSKRFLERILQSLIAAKFSNPLEDDGPGAVGHEWSTVVSSHQPE